jgi:tetratricopeptide (TPR) repeat protein
MRRGRLDDALKMAKQVSARAPNDLRVLLALARAQLANGDQAGSRATLTSATLVAGFDAPVQTEVALLQVAARNLTGAAYCLDKALSAQPNYLPAQSLAVEVQWRQGDFAKAELGAQQIVKAEPKLALGYNLLGDVALARDQPAAAVEAYRRAYQVQPSSYTLTRLFNVLDRRDPGAALQLVAAWVKSHPDDAIARKLLAQAYAQSNDLVAARREYEQVRRMLPKDADVLNDLANVMLRSNDPQAQAVAEQALALAPDRFMTIDTAGWAAYKAGKLDRSLELLRDARLRNPESSEVRYHLAATLTKIGRKEEAREELQAALRLEPKFQGRDDAESLLRTLK